MQFNFIDVITLLGIIQGFFLAFVLFRLNKSNKNANTILAWTLVIASSVLLGRLIIAHNIAPHIFRWISFTDGIIFLLGPLTYLYVRRLLLESKKPYILPYYHYFPAIIYAIIFLFLRAQDEAQTALLYQQGSIYWIFNSFELVGLISNFYYLFRSYKLLLVYKKQEAKLLSYRQEFFRFLLIYLTAIALCIVLWLFSYINAYYLQRFFEYVHYNNIWFAVPFFIYVVGYFSLKQPEIFRMTHVSSKNLSTSRLSDVDVKQLKKRLESAMKENKVFLQPDLTLGQVANQIDSSPNDLSWLLNKIYKSNFYDFVNKYRVKEFIHAIEREEHYNLTILSIALDSGFKSKSTFNKAFKFQMNMTPSQYIKSLDTQVQVA